ncbi:hypothetical protein DFP73DRAFT_322486 [Morchella snyderi]|nr:hypothetical protein DFP73DRAFT_322486 [Morchella snyderi]
MSSSHFPPQGVQTTGIPRVLPMNDKNILATNGLQPTVLTSNVRVPPGHIERVASARANGKIPINSLLTSPQSFIAHPPRTNAQARTARKSAFHVSPSSRGDGGYSTSPSSNSGRKCVSGSSSEGDKRESGSLSTGGVSSDSPIRVQAKNSLENHKHTPNKFPPPPKPQQIQQTPQPSTNNEDSCSTMTAAASSAAPASEAAAPSSAAAVPSKSSCTKRLQLVLSETISSTKPKRQKVATAKAAALAKEPFMNADGTAVKKRRPPGVMSEKEKARERRRAKAIKGSGKFSLRETIEPITGATINVAAKPQPVAHLPRPKHLQRGPVVPTLPPRYEIPRSRYLQRQPVSNVQLETTNSSAPPSVAHEPIFIEYNASSQAAIPHPTPKPNSKTPNRSSTSRALHKAQGSSLTEAILIDSSPSSVEKNKNNRFKPQNEKRRALGKPPVYNIPSDSDDITINLPSPQPGEDTRRTQRDESSNTSSYAGLTGALSVTEVLFTKCLSSLTRPDERKRLYIGIEDIIQRLEIQKDQSKPLQPLRHPITWSENRAHPTTEHLAVLLRRLCVVTDEGSTVTFECWKEEKRRFKGQFILAVREEPGKALAAEVSKSHIPESISASGTSSTIRSPGNSRRTSITSESGGSHYSVPNAQEMGNSLEKLVGRNLQRTEGSIASDVVQLVGSLSSPLNLQESVLSEEPTGAICSTEYIDEQTLGAFDDPQGEEGLPGPIMENPEISAEHEEEELPNQVAENQVAVGEEEEGLTSPTMGNLGAAAEPEEEGSPSPAVENPEVAAESKEAGLPSSMMQTSDPGVVAVPPSPNNQIQENAASATTLDSSVTTVTKPLISKKRKRKIFERVTVEDLLGESRSDNALQVHQASLLLRKRQEKDDVHFSRILRLNKAESDIKAELDSLNESVKSQELSCQRKIDASLKDTNNGGNANWEEYRELISKRDRLREDYTREAVRLVDKASRITGERAWCLSQRKKSVEELDVATQDKGPSDGSTTPTATTSASSVSDLIDASLGPVPFSIMDHFPITDPIPTEAGVEGYSMAREFLKRLIPWATVQPETAPDLAPAEPEAAAAIAAADAKKKIRRKKRLRW